MYLPEQPHPLDFYKEGGCGNGGMLIEAPSVDAAALHPHSAPAPMAESSGEEPEVKAPRKRAETWGQDETHSLISLRRDVDGMFNAAKSNKHLWEQISIRMRDRGFDRSPAMCTDKWRNLLKDFKKARHHHAREPSKMVYYKELDELIRDRTRDTPAKPHSIASKADPYLHHSDKGIEDGEIPFGSIEVNGRSNSTVNLERGMDHDGNPLAISAADAATNNGGPPWNWRDSSLNGGDNPTEFSGRVILVKWGEYTKNIGIDGTPEGIKEIVKLAFGLRSRRPFWLEDEDEVVRCLDRDMPLGTYTLHLDEGITIKICAYDDPERLTIRTEDKTFYTNEDMQDFLIRRHWSGLRELSGFNTVDSIDELNPGTIYQGIRLT